MTETASQRDQRLLNARSRLWWREHDELMEMKKQRNEIYRPRTADSQALGIQDGLRFEPVSAAERSGIVSRPSNGTSCSPFNDHRIAVSGQPDNPSGPGADKRGGFLRPMTMDEVWIRGRIVDQGPTREERAEIVERGK